MRGVVGAGISLVAGSHNRNHARERVGTGMKQGRMTAKEGGWQERLWPWIPWLVAGVEFLVFLPVLGHEFLSYDDALNVVDNSYVMQLSLGHLQRVWSAPLHGLYIPLTYTLWSLLAKLSQFLPVAADGVVQPVLFHSVNLLCHLASSVVVFFLLQRLVAQRWAAALGALFFGLHPVQVEAVAWITGLKDLLAGLFALLALWGYVVGSQSSGAGKWNKAYRLATLAFGAALLSKPAAVVVPVLAAVVGYLFLEKTPRQLVRELCPWLLLTIPVVWLTAGEQGVAAQGFVPALWQRFMVAGDSISFYLFKLIFPWNLGPDYMRSPQALLQTDWWLATGLLPYLLGAGICWRYRRPWLLGVSGIFVGALLPVLGFVSFTFQDVSTVSDRYLYLAMLGPALAVAWVMAHQPRRLAWAALSLALLGFALKSTDQVWHWEDSLTFYQEAVEVNPRSYTAYNNLGVVYKKLQRREEAMAAYRQAIAIEPRFAEAYANIAHLYRDGGRLKEAIAWFQQALAMKPDYAEAYANLGDIYKEQQRTAEAIAAYQKALAIKPGLASVHAHLGLLYQESGQQEKAISSYRQAIANKRDFYDAHNNLGVLLQEGRQFEAAVEAYKKAIVYKVDFAEAYNNLGFLYCLLERCGEAVAPLQKAIEYNPNHPLPYNNLARVYLHLKQIAAAREYADLAKRRGYLDPQLAQSLAAQGN